MFLNGKFESGSPEDKAIRRFCRLWTNFAKYGNPTPSDDDHLLQIKWKNFTKNEQNYLEINQELGDRVDPLKERMAFWEDLYVNRNKEN